MLTCRKSCIQIAGATGREAEICHRCGAGLIVHDDGGDRPCDAAHITGCLSTARKQVFSIILYTESVYRNNGPKPVLVYCSNALASTKSVGHVFWRSIAPKITPPLRCCGVEQCECQLSKSIPACSKGRARLLTGSHVFRPSDRRCVVVGADCEWSARALQSRVS